MSTNSLILNDLLLVECEQTKVDDIQPNYFDLLDETPEFSEAAILLEDDVIEYCYVKMQNDGKQYFGFDRCLPGADEYKKIIDRHKLVNVCFQVTAEWPGTTTFGAKRTLFQHVLDLGLLPKAQLCLIAWPETPHSFRTIKRC